LHDQGEQIRKPAKGRSGRSAPNGRPYDTICLVSFCLIASLCAVSCGSKAVDVRTLTPGDALVYLGSKDLSQTIGALVESRSFNETAASRPDLSSLRGVEIAVAVTGFEMSEQRINEENSIGRIRPHFVAIADTHAWSWQTLRFTENQLGEFVNKVYGGGVNLDVSDKPDGKYFVWTAEDGRKAYALVQGSVISFGNDESAIEKSLAVKRGEADSIVKNPKIQDPQPDEIASGYISPDGIAQVANLAGITMAAGSGEEDEVKSFIARIIPQLLQRSVTEINWSAHRVNGTIEDRYTIGMPADVSSVLAETFVPAEASDKGLFELLSTDAQSVTLYGLRDPQIAWRSVLLLAQKQSDAVAGKIISEFSGSLFEPYGIKDPEMFLSAVGPSILTARFDADGEKLIVITTVRDAAKVKSSISTDLKPDKNPSGGPAVDMLRSQDGDTAAAFIGNRLILGDAESVAKCVAANQNGSNFSKSDNFARVPAAKGLAVTYGTDRVTAGKVAEVLSEKKSADAASVSWYLTETGFSRNSMMRKTTSDLGLIGTFIAQMSGEE
jgi:hypothetical protein